MNLASNAVYSMGDDGGNLTIGLSNVTFKEGELTPEDNPGRYVELSVSDTGAGMSDEVKARVFEPFFTTKGQGEGTGMGLAVAFGIIKSHGGAITVESKEGKGSTFSLFFPVCIEPEVEEVRNVTRSLSRGKERILLVDDEPLVLDMVAKILRSLGYIVVTAPGGPEAFEIFQKDPGNFDLIITDHVMPEVTGIRLAEKLLKVRKDIPVILFTGYSDAVTPNKAKQVGISSFVMKPVVKSELAQAVRRVLDKKRSAE
ncbi:MAG: Blue-light-activated protein [Syntrophorhabdaceae bacterium PtaU1.Bin034]|nr:MAG: Blue-light-activated protein [Syntrophorhabdaceae bacterium PtaU1.Bin034]